MKMGWSVVFCLTTMLITGRAYTANIENGTDAGSSITVPPECVGQKFCLTKPVDYPSEEVDRIAQTLQKRWKRHSFEYNPQNINEVDGSNNCAALRTTIQPFMIIHNNMQHVVVQSKFLTQTFPIASCKTENAHCFQDLVRRRVKTKCRTKYVTFLLTTFNPKDSKIKHIGSLFPVDCACELDSTEIY